MSYGAEIVELTKQFFVEDVKFDEEELEILKQETTATVFEDFLTKVTEVEEFTADNIKALINRFKKIQG